MAKYRKIIEVEFNRSDFGSKADKVISKLDGLILFHHTNPHLIVRSIKAFKVLPDNKIMMRAEVEDRD